MLNTLSGDCNFEISGLRYWMKRQCVKLQHTNDQAKVGPGKYRAISSCFSIWWKNLSCSFSKHLPFKKKESQNTKTNLLCKLLWTCYKITEIQQEVTFKHYNYLEDVLNYICVLLQINGILEDWYNVSLKEVCEALQKNFL